MSVLSSTKIWERCEVLRREGKGLLEQAATYRRSKRPSLAHPDLTKLKQKLEKSYPEVPDLSKFQGPGIEIAAKKAGEIVMEHQPLFDLMLDAMAYQQEVLSTIQALPSLITFMKLDQCSQAVVYFMDLLVDYLKFYLVMSMIEEPQAALALYNHAHNHAKHFIPEETRSIYMFMSRFEKPLLQVPEDLQPVSEAVGTVLHELQETISTAFDTEKLRQKNALNPLEEGLAMVLPTAMQLSPRLPAPLHDELMLADHYAQWVVYSIFCCPAELVRPEVLMLFQTVASCFLVIPLHSELTFDIHVQAELLAAKYPPKGFNVAVPKSLKLKKEFKDLATSAYIRTSEVRRERRSYLCGEMLNLAALFRDTPGLIAPKFPMVLAALAMAKAEVVYYFSHLTHDSSKLKAKVKQFKLEDYFDGNMAFLIAASVELTSLAKTHKDIIQQYYVEYLQGAHKLAVTEMLAKAKGVAPGNIQPLLDSIPDALANPSPAGLEALRADWSRAAMLLASSDGGGACKRSEFTGLIRRMRTVYTHSTYADSVEELLIQHCELTPMWFFQRPMVTIFEKQCLSSNDSRSRCAVAFIRVLAAVADAVHPGCPEEQWRRGEAAARLATQMVETLKKRIDAILMSLCERIIQLSSQVEPVEAAYRLERMQQTSQLEPLPGYESQAINHQAVKPLEGLQVSAANLFWAIGKTPEVIVFNRFFNLKALARDRLEKFLTKAFNRASKTKAGTLASPSYLLHAYRLTTSSLQMAAGYLEADVSGMVRNVLFTCAISSAEAFQEPGQAAVTLKLKAEAAETPCMALEYAKWYKTLCVQATPNGEFQGMVYMGSMRGFAKADAEKMCDLTEFQCLYTLLGGQGFSLIQNEICRVMTNALDHIKQFLVDNSSLLVKFKQRYTDPGLWDTVPAELKGLNNFVIYTIVLGNCLALRRILARAVRSGSDASVPFAGNIFEIARHAMSQTSFHDAEALNTVAQDLGLMNMERSLDIDMALKHVVTNAGASTQEVQTVWAGLPYAYAAAFFSEAWQNTTYDARNDVFNNNMHTSSIAMAELFKCLKENAGGPRVMFGTFFKVSSFLLLRMKATEKYALSFPLRGMFVYLEKVVQESGAVGRAILEEFVPYPLIHSSLMEIAALKAR